MSLLRALYILVGLLVPPAALTLGVRALYGLGWVMSVILFLVLASLWAEGARALRRSG